MVLVVVVGAAVGIVLSINKTKKDEKSEKLSPNLDDGTSLGSDDYAASQTFSAQARLVWLSEMLNIPLPDSSSSSSSSVPFNVRSSPQYQALDWLTNDDIFVVNSMEDYYNHQLQKEEEKYHEEHVKITISERYALVVFSFRLAGI